MWANNDNCPEALLAVMDAAAAERVVRLASPVIQEERPFQFFDLLMRGISVLLSRITIRFSAVLSAAPIRQPFALSARQRRHRKNARCC